MEFTKEESRTFIKTIIERIEVLRNAETQKEFEELITLTDILFKIGTE